MISEIRLLRVLIIVWPLLHEFGATVPLYLLLLCGEMQVKAFPLFNFIKLSFVNPLFGFDIMSWTSAELISRHCGIADKSACECVEFNVNKERHKRVLYSQFMIFYLMFIIYVILSYLTALDKYVLGVKIAWFLCFFVHNCVCSCWWQWCCRLIKP